MRMPFDSSGRLRLAVFGLVLLVTPVARAEWQRDGSTMGWSVKGKIIWQFSFDPKKGKPFFHPLSVNDVGLTNFRPEDHPWHYGLWFSWKYINGINYWEENRQTGHSDGVTGWSAPRIDSQADGSATIRLDLTYTHPSGRVDMTEVRELEVSAPNADGSYYIEWRAHFTAGKEGAVLGRTAMMGEPDGQVNGGYAGLSMRLASAPMMMSVVTSEAPVTAFANNRARPAASAVGCNFSEGDKQIGSIAILSDPANIGERAPWYIVNADMRFTCAAILAPQVRTLPPGGDWKLHYRIVLRPTAWTPETLRAGVTEWLGAAGESPDSSGSRK